MKWLKRIPGIYHLTRAVYQYVGAPSLKILFSTVSWKKKWNYMKIAYSSARKLEISLGSPLLLTIESINACNLQCPICETGAGILERPVKMLSYENFKTILGKFDDNLEVLYFYFMGEPFLNHRAYEMIQYAIEQGLWVITCTNAEFIDPEKLVLSGIQEVNFQIGGMSQETHQIYRIQGNLDRTLANLERTLELRKHYGLEAQMRIVLGFILMKHNEHEIETFVRYCQAKGVDDYHIIGTCARTVEQAKKYMPSVPEYRIYDEVKLARGLLVPKRGGMSSCGWLYSAVTVNVQGDVVPCCRDPQGKYVMGNILEDDGSFFDVWNGASYRRLRSAVGKSGFQHKLCELCQGEHVVLPRVK